MRIIIKSLRKKKERVLLPPQMPFDLSKEEKG
jgi:hypothetical protein